MFVRGLTAHANKPVNAYCNSDHVGGSICSPPHSNKA